MPVNQLRMLQFNCGACGMALRLPAACQGQKAKCPRCRGTLGIPQGEWAGRTAVAPRLCNACGGEVTPEDLQTQGLEEVFCGPCIEEMCRKTDSTILREVGLEIPGLKVIRREDTLPERTRTRIKRRPGKTKP